MLRSASDLEGFAIQATDGRIGEVDQFYFDDEKWTIRYLVANTGGWLLGKRVLISPAALSQVDWNSRILHVNITRQQVENSPSIDTDRPVSRQKEMEYHDYYRYPYYWAGPYAWGPVMYPPYPPLPPQAEPTGAEQEKRQAEREQADVHLRSTREVGSYYIEGLDGDMGHVEDFLIEDRSWTIRYIVVDTRNWWPGKKVLVSPEWISSVSWNDSRVHVDLPRYRMKNAPEYDPSVPLSRDYEAALYDHYGRSEYWSR